MLTGPDSAKSSSLIGFSCRRQMSGNSSWYGALGFRFAMSCLIVSRFPATWRILVFFCFFSCAVFFTPLLKQYPYAEKPAPPMDFHIFRRFFDWIMDGPPNGLTFANSTTAIGSW